MMIRWVNGGIPSQRFAAGVAGGSFFLRSWADFQATAGDFVVLFRRRRDR